MSSDTFDTTNNPTKKYYRYKHKIDFYLKSNNENDFSKYMFTFDESGATKDINILRWDYLKIVKPDMKMLKLVKTNRGFYEHRNKNMLLHPEEFILSISFEIGIYPDGMIIYDKFKDLPYIWFVKKSVNRTHPYMNNISKYFSFDNSIMSVKLEMDFDNKTNLYFKCSLLPIRNIEPNNIINFVSSKQITPQVASKQESTPIEIKEPVIIPKVRSSLQRSNTLPLPKKKIYPSLEQLDKFESVEINVNKATYEHPKPVIAPAK